VSVTGRVYPGESLSSPVTRILGYRRLVRRSSRAGDGPPHLTLGGLHRSLLDGIGQHRDASIAIDFEQRSSVSQMADEPGEHPGLFVARRFEARLDSRGGRVDAAQLTSSGMSRQPHSRIWLARDDSRYLYSIDGVRFGPMQGRPDLFDLARFERRLDDVAVTDVTIEQVPRQPAGSVIVLEADVDVESFRRLLEVFASGSGDSDDDLDLRSFSVALSSADDVALDYWWSLVGNEMPDGLETVYRRTVACHVQVSVATLDPSAQERFGPIAVDPGLPVLRHIDDVWRLANAALLDPRAAPAKATRTARRKPRS
jgi:hypothetical protein